MKFLLGFWHLDHGSYVFNEVEVHGSQLSETLEKLNSRLVRVGQLGGVVGQIHLTNEKVLTSIALLISIIEYMSYHFMINISV